MIISQSPDLSLIHSPYLDGIIDPAEYEGETYTAEDYAFIATCLDDACRNAYNAGIIVVAAAGNEATWHKSYPACNYKVVGVGALGPNKENRLAAFTNYVLPSQTGEKNVDILAPGHVYTAHQTGGQYSVQHTYDETQGTSFSSPIVAGAACLWKERNPDGTPDQFLAKLQSTASDIGTYSNKKVPVSDYGSSYTDAGPSNITVGRLNVPSLLDMDSPYVVVKQSSVNIAEGGKKQIDLGATNGDITYVMKDTTIATVSNSGLVTGVKVGNTELDVIATKNSNTYKVTIPITIVPKVACDEITLSTDSISLSVGETYEIEPTISTVPTNATREFMYSSNNEDVVTVDFETGLVTAVGEGSTTIDILAAEGDGIAELTVEVSEADVISWNKVTSNSGLVSGGEYIFAYGTSYVSGRLNGGTYLEALSGATFSNGVITALPSGYESFILGTSGNKYTLKQTSDGQYLGYNSKNLTSNLTATGWTISISSGDATISDGGYELMYNTSSPRWKTYDPSFGGGDYSLYKKTSSVPAKITGVGLNKNALALNVGGSETLIATVSGTGDYDHTVTWTSSDATVASVSNAGLVTALKAGTATITASAGSFTATCTVTVTTVPVTGVSLNTNNLELVVGANSTLSATVTPSNATNKAVNWASSNTSVATVDANGQVSAKAVGTATVTVTTADGGFTATCSVSVITIPATGVTLNKSSESLYVNGSVTLVATVTPSNATNKSVTWSSSNVSVAAVSSSGVVTAKAVGTSAITVTTVDGGFTATCNITVQQGKSSMQIAYEAAAALESGATTSNAYTFTGIVTSSSSDSFYVQDGDYAMYVYRYSSFTTSRIGQKATVQATLTNYNGTLETKTISSVTFENTEDTITPKNVTSYDYLSNLNQSILSNLTSGVVAEKTSPITSKSKDMKFTVTIGGQTITVFGSKYLNAYSTINSYYNSFKVGDYISIANCVSSVNYGNIQLSITEQTTMTVGYSLESYCREFLGNIICNSQGTSAPTYATGYSWSQLKTLFSKLSTADQNTLKSADIDEDGSLVEQVAARYNYIVNKYHYENFMSRTIVNMGFAPYIVNDNSYGFVVIIVAITFVSVTSILVVNKKKKINNYN